MRDKFRYPEPVYDDTIASVKTCASKMFASFAVSTAQNLESTPGESWAINVTSVNCRIVEKGL